jgi:hypothetical protein
MALTAEQQSQLDVSLAIEANRHTNSIEFQAKQIKLEMVRIAKEVLIENAKSKAVDSRDVSAADITTFANSLVAFVDA